MRCGLNEHSVFCEPYFKQPSRVWFPPMFSLRAYRNSTKKNFFLIISGIIYEDGAVIVGTVDGQRLWGKELKTNLAFVEWGELFFSSE